MVALSSAAAVLCTLCTLATVSGFPGAQRSSVTRRASHELNMVLPMRPGSVVALVTPMTDKNAIDYEQLQALLQWHVREGTDGAVILGTTGEASTVTMEERTEIIKTAVRTVNGAFPVVVGTGTIETHKVIELSKHAASLGADATLVITPYYVKPPPRALVQHYRTIADAVPLPMILYNCPGRTGIDMKPETIAEIASHPNVVGIKDATGDLARVAIFRQLCGKDFMVYSGEDDSGCEFVRLGGDGVISVTANVSPKAMRTMLALSKDGRQADAEAINTTLMPLHKRLFLEANPIPVKRALQVMGKIGGGIRPPLVPMDDAVHLDALREALIIGKAL